MPMFFLKFETRVPDFHGVTSKTVESSPGMDIYHLSEKELLELNRRVIERLKELEALRNNNERLDLQVGDRVGFEPVSGAMVKGTLTKFNSTTVCVLTDDGEKWNVSPRFLVKLRPSRPSLKKGNIIRLPT